MSEELGVSSPCAVLRFFIMGLALLLFWPEKGREGGRRKGGREGRKKRGKRGKEVGKAGREEGERRRMK